MEISQFICKLVRMRCSRILLLTALLCGFLIASAQGEYNNWFFGGRAGLTFNSGAPVAILGSQSSSGEGCASISDAAGNLLFYSNGAEIWNRNHVVMPNGSALMGGLSSSQSSLILPVPGDEGKYYVFTLEDMSAPGGLYYSIVDMQLAGGLGDVVASSKNVYVSANNLEMLTAANSADCGFWVITHKRGLSTFEAIQITENGLGTRVSTDVGELLNLSAGVMKVSPDNKRLAFASLANKLSMVFDFDAATGVISNGIELPSEGNLSPYGTSFSPDSKTLYVTEGQMGDFFKVFQFSLDGPTAPEVRSSRLLAGTVNTIPAVASFCDLNIGPDGKIYIARTGKTCISVINSPNVRGAGCDFQELGPCLEGRFSTLGLPNPGRTLHKVEEVLGRDTSLCPGTSLTLTAPASTGTILWSTGATTPTITIQTNGKYWVRVRRGNCLISDTINVSFDGERAALGPDQTLCPGGSLNLKPSGTFTSIVWQDNSLTPQLQVTSPGLYWVEVTDRCGQVTRDSVHVRTVIYSIDLGPDAVRCTGTSLQLTAPGGFLNYAWGPAYNTTDPHAQTINVTPDVDTVYFVRAEKTPGCFVSDTLRVRVEEGLAFNLGADTLICPGTTVAYSRPASLLNAEWSDGSRGNVIRIGEPSNVWLTGNTANGCVSSDTVVVAWKECPVEFWVPSAFTPNGDGNNDLFRVLYKGLFEKFEMTVYNRWGGVAFRSTNPQLGWDGSGKGGGLSTGVFVWVCRYRFKGKEETTVRGTVTLVR